MIMVNLSKDLKPLKRKALRLECLREDKNDLSVKVSFEIYKSSNVVLVVFPDGNYFGFPSVQAAIDFLRINFDF